MAVKTSPVLSVPTNIITGFLGAGKTSAILNLLKHKPADERWAILVNEFGEIGVDGSLLEGSAGRDTDIHIREVPGGCMCCAAGLPMQIALNQLLRRAKPHRLLIEPTGLGHPLEVLQILSASHNSEILSIDKTLTLVDARNIADERYAAHATFRQQLSIADLVVANKVDLYEQGDRAALESFVGDYCHPQSEIVYTQYGDLALSHLTGPTVINVEPGTQGHGGTTPTLLAEDLPLPDCGYVTAVNAGEGFESIGWRFSPQKVFSRSRLISFMSQLDVERMKAVFITATGVFGYNLTRDALTETALDDCAESRIEIITDQIDQNWADNLTDCVVTGP